MAKFQTPSALNGDAFGNFPPKAGGAVAVIAKEITFEDTDEIAIGTLYAGSVVTSVKVAVNTAFDSGTSDVLTVGIAGNTDLYVDDLDLQAAATSRDGDTSVPAIITLTPLTTETDVVANVTSDGGSLTEGSAVVIVSYIRKAS